MFARVSTVREHHCEYHLYYSRRVGSCKPTKATTSLTRSKCPSERPRRADYILIARRSTRRWRGIRAQASSRVEIRARGAIVIRSRSECGATGNQPSNCNRGDNEFHGLFSIARQAFNSVALPISRRRITRRFPDLAICVAPETLRVSLDPPHGN